MRKFSSILIGVVMLTLGLGVGRLSAGSPDSPGGPNSPAAQMYTLEQIYQRLSSGAAGTQMTTFTEPGTAPGTGTMHTLNDIMTQAPAADNINGVTKANVLTGKTFWGLSSGQWGLRTGTAVAGSNVSGANGAKTFTIPDGFYSGSKIATANDTNLVSGNIKGGVNIFGVTGAISPSGVPKTGQTVSFVATDDGALQKGVAWPNPRFTNNNNGTVTDNLTGLIWLKNANCASATRTWATALITDVVSLNSVGSMNGFGCGDASNAGNHQTDWRVPNVREMQSLVRYGLFAPAVPNTAGTGQWAAGDPFDNLQSNYYWSSTANTSYAWLVDLDAGGVYGYIKVEAGYVWPVRGGQ